jgi:hypothetical protein
MKPQIPREDFNPLKPFGIPNRGSIESMLMAGIDLFGAYIAFGEST